jgi:hypothetical protein
MTGERRVLILAEGYSADPHYGKTLRGVLRYRREDVVAILDSARAGEAMAGVPIVAGVEESLRFAPNVALVGVATQGGTFPPAWRELLRCASATASRSRTACTSSVAGDPEPPSWPRASAPRSPTCDARRRA